MVIEAIALYMLHKGSATETHSQASAYILLTKHAILKRGEGWKEKREGKMRLGYKINN